MSGMRHRHGTLTLSAVMHCLMDVRTRCMPQEMDLTEEESRSVIDVSLTSSRDVPLPAMSIVCARMSEPLVSTSAAMACGELLHIVFSCGLVACTAVINVSVCHGPYVQPKQFPTGKMHAKYANLPVWHAVHDAQLHAVVFSDLTFIYICTLLQFGPAPCCSLAQHPAANWPSTLLPFGPAPCCHLAQHPAAIWPSTLLQFGPAPCCNLAQHTAANRLTSKLPFHRFAHADSKS